MLGSCPRTAHSGARRKALVTGDASAPERAPVRSLRAEALAEAGPPAALSKADPIESKHSRRRMSKKPHVIRP
jgi:hypothetical protein